MDTKNRLTNHLLKVAKKHRILTYPVLALVALISVFSYFFNWSTGAGKRVVAIVMVMVMLVSQSYFLTSSANELTLTDDTAVLLTENNSQDNTVQPEGMQDTAPEADTLKDSGEGSPETKSVEGASETEMGETTEATTEESSDVQNGESGSDAVALASTSDEPTDEPQGATLTIKVRYNNGASISVGPEYKVTNGVISSSAGSNTGTFDINIGNIRSDLSANYTSNGCYEFESDFYLNENFSEKLPASSSVSVELDDNLSGTLDLYAKRKPIKYRVKINKNIGTSTSSSDVTYTPSDGLSENADGYFYVPIGNDFTISGISRKGYDFAGCSGATASVETSLLTVTKPSDSSNVSDIEVILNWKPKTYKIQYDTDGDGNVDETDEFTYDSSESCFLTGDAAVDKLGYTFDKWVDAGDSNKVYEGGTYVIGSQNDFYYEGDKPTVVLKPTYTYNGIVVKTDLLKTYYFGDEVDDTISGCYDKSGEKGNNFNYHLSGAGNLAAYNMDAVAGNEGIHIFTKDGTGITQTTGSGSPIKLTFYITDSSAPADKQQSKTFEIQINISPKVIKLEPPSKTITKTYDGTTDVLSSWAKKTFNVVGEDNQPVSGVTVEVSGGKYNSQNVSEANAIVYDKENAVIHPPAGVNSSNYVLDEVSIPASIEARDVTVIITPKKDTILAGEADPEYTISLKSPNSSTGIIEGDSEADVIRGIEASSNRPQDNLLKTGEYKFTPTFKGLSTNYKASMDISGYGSFTVEQESPEGKYTIGDGTSSGQNGWMLGNASIVANPDSGYDEVWVSKDGSHYEKFTGTITEADAGKTYKLYLRNSNSKAQTSVADVLIKVDGSKPVYKGYKVINNNLEEPGSFEYNVDIPSALKNGGLYFPGYGTVLDFGTYMKTQMTLEIKYEDIKPGSGLGAGAGLYYSLFGSSEEKSVVFDEDGVAKISINKELVADADTSVGVIRCYATDVAGNKSDVITLSPNGSDVYEWSIESIEPTIGTLAVYHGDSKVAITNTENYYSDCVATVSVGDSLSGLYKLVWNVNGTEHEQRITGQSGENTPYNKVSTTKEYSLPINQKDFPSENLTYTVSVTAVDNAGNESKSNKVQFKTDDVDPELKVKYDDKVYTSETTIPFTCWDTLNGNKNTSGIKSVYVTGPDGITNTCHLDSIDSEGKYKGYFEIIDKGVYTLYVEDNAGNITKWEKEIKMISKEVPACPTVSVTPEPETDEKGNEVAEYWYNSVTGAPTITIGNVTETLDGTPTETYYRHFKNDETAYDDVLISASEEERVITIAENDEGIHTFKHWSESASGVECKDADNHVTVLRYDGTAPKIKVANVPEESSGSTVLIRFTVSDDISGVNKDTIQVLRNGKNYDATIEKTENGYVGSFVVKETGNYEVCASDIAGNKANVAGFTPMSMVVNPVSNITTSKVTISANVYKGTANVSSAPTISIRKLTEEDYRECENTLANKDEKNGNWSLSSVFDGLEENTVYVYKVHAVSDINEVLEYEGYLRTSSSTNDGGIIRGTVGYPEGTKLPDWNTSGQITVGLYDGNICIAATVADAGGPFAFTNVPDGTYNIVATDGVYTKSQGVTMDNHVVVKPGDVISLILSGQNTSVVITSPETPKVIADNMDSIFLYDTVVNFNDADRALIEANGTVEFRLYATLTSVVDVSKDELAVIQRVGSNGKIVAKYLNLSLEKITTDASGNVDRTQVSELSNGASITITIPLQDLAGKKGIEVVRIHDGSGGLEGYRYEVDLDSNPNTFTLTSNKFSTYAILYSPDEQIDEPSTQEPSVDNPSKDDPNVNEPDKNKPASDGAKPIAPGDKTAQAATTSTSFGSVGSGSGSAKTGDMTPVAALTFVMMIALGGVFTLRKKIK